MDSVSASVGIQQRERVRAVPSELLIRFPFMSLHRFPEKDDVAIPFPPFSPSTHQVAKKSMTTSWSPAP